MTTSSHQASLEEAAKDIHRSQSPVINGERRTVPDPSAAVMVLVQREIGSVEKLLDVKIAAIEKSIDTAHDDLVRVPTDVQKQVGALKELMHAEIGLLASKFDIHAQRFHNIEVQFAERDKRNELALTASGQAIKDALVSQKEAVTEQQKYNDRATEKSDANFSSLINAQGTLLTQSKSELDRRIEELRGAVNTVATMLATVQTQMATRTEVVKDTREVSRDTREGKSDNLGAWIAGAIALIAFFAWAGPLMQRGGGG